GLQVQVDFGDVGAGQVVDGDGVGAALGVEVDLLDAHEVHRHAGHVAGEKYPRAVGRDVDVLVVVGAVEDHRVMAALALDDVTAVARFPDERVAAGAQEGNIGALAANNQVVAVAADEDVVAVAAVLGQRDGVGGQAGGVHHVVAGQGADPQLIVGRVGAGD